MAQEHLRNNQDLVLQEMAMAQTGVRHQAQDTEHPSLLLYMHGIRWWKVQYMG
jgi:hypothetical protein